MSKLIAWLKVEPKGIALWQFFSVSVVVLFAYALLAGLIQSVFGVEHFRNTVVERMIRDNLALLILSLIPLAAIEEFLTRLPLVFFVGKDTPPAMLGAAVIALSMFFGYMHGGWIGVPLQGVGGIILCAVFLKCGGLQKKYGKAFISSTAVHVAYNALALMYTILVTQ